MKLGFIYGWVLPAAVAKSVDEIYPDNDISLSSDGLRRINDFGR